MIDCGNRSDNDSDWIILSLVGSLCVVTRTMGEGRVKQSVK